MRILHTADLHLGRHFEGFSLERDHAAALDQVFQAIVAHAPDVLIVAGDIFDRAAPPETAVRQFNDFTRRVVSETDAAIVLIAGNHDSGDRIGAMSMLADRRRSLVRGPLSQDEPPLILNDAHGPVAISALPFAYELAARECFGEPGIKSPEDVLRAQVAAARRHVPSGARWVVVAHAFVAGAEVSGVERPLSRTVGGMETVPASVFEGAHYVALGHLHRAQEVGSAHVRYAGAPLAYGFDEEGCQKSMALVDLSADGRADVSLLPFSPLRRVRTLQGTLDELLNGTAAASGEDLVRIILTDPGRLIDPMKRIRERYPNACTLSYERDLIAGTEKTARAASSALDDPAKLLDEFMAFTRGSPPSTEEATIIAHEIAAATTREEAAA